jgi:hypothetical protein
MIDYANLSPLALFLPSFFPEPVFAPLPEPFFAPLPESFFAPLPEPFSDACSFGA